ncbi:MAG: HesA/MoeB/ThiF family protein [Chthoniobacterales bacterium]|nr:HesA/MoeB/ThiF family protein [Chthoniobacterales bacterium]
MMPGPENPREHPPKLTQEELAAYAWQLDLAGLGEAGQRKLKGASVLISRVGGVGGIVALQLAAAGVGKLVLATGGVLKPSDLNRQLLQADHQIGSVRMENIVRRLREFNPRLEVVGFAENASESNATGLVAQADLIVDAAPLFEERFALNRAAIAARKPMVECAMYALEAQLTCILPGRSPCLECFVSEKPLEWRRRFPVLGAVSGTVGCLAAIEAVKLITGIGRPLAGVLLTLDLGTMEFRRLRLARRKDCPVCASVPSPPEPV